jgi:hypothetical protein
MRLQSSLEFIITYSWALLIISLFMATMVIISLSHPAQNYIPSQCSITPLLPCLDTLFTINPMVFTLEFQNNLGQAMYFTPNALNVLTSGTIVPGTHNSVGNCAPALLPVGGEEVCNALISGTFTLPTSAQFLTTFNLTYELCSGNTFNSCNTPTYTTSGSSLQAVSPTSVSFYAVNFETNVPSYGTIVLNGVPYPTCDIAYFVSGNYVVFAQPALGHKFQTWNIIPASVLGANVASTTAQNTVLSIVSSNSVLTANFV